MGFKDVLMKAVNLGSEAKFMVKIGEEEFQEISYIQLGTYLVSNEHQIKNIKISLRED